MGPTPAPISVNIDFKNDLTDASHLKSLLTDGGNPIATLGREFNAFVDGPVSGVVMDKPVVVTIAAPGKWALPGGLGFSLDVSASCSVMISAGSTQFAVATNIDSDATSPVGQGPFDGARWINLEFVFGIVGNIVGDVKAGAIGICGHAGGGASATVSYCHKVDASTNTLEALKEALSAFTFPLHPDCALSMPPGDVARACFAANLSLGVGVSYGLGSFKFFAPGVDAATKSFNLGKNSFTPPSLDIDAVAKASVGYTHSDNFSVIVVKSDASNATLYLTRASSDEFDLSASISVGITPGKVDVAPDAMALVNAVNRVTGGQGGAKVAGLVGDVKNGLVAQANGFIGKAGVSAGLSAALARQHNRALLFAFAVDLTQADLTRQSWTALISGDVRAAEQIGGFKLLTGSGVTDRMKRSVTVGLHFFNLFSATDISTFFRNSTTEVAPDGSIRFLFDVGKESEQDTKKSMKKTRIHFVAGATDESETEVDKVQVDLQIEFAESGSAQEAARIAATVGTIAGDDARAAAQTIASAAGKLNVVTILKESAYSRIACSPFNGSQPPVDQTEDQANWDAFHNAAVAITDLEFLSGVTYVHWAAYNVACTGGSAADRRHFGNPAAGKTVEPSELVGFFLRGSARFMNLCDDLGALASAEAAVNTVQTWNALLDSLTHIVNDDTSADWSKPAAAAIFNRFATHGAQVAVVQSNGDVTCTITLT